MAAGATKQDMPPAGGYRAIPFARNPAKTYFSGVAVFAGFIACSAYGMFMYVRAKKIITRNKVEQRSGYLALAPLIAAEQDREILKQVRRNRDEEARLMANVPGWEVGTYYGEELYKSLPEDTWIDPTMRELYAHASDKEYRKRAMFNFWT